MVAAQPGKVADLIAWLESPSGDVFPWCRMAAAQLRRLEGDNERRRAHIAALHEQVITKISNAEAQRDALADALTLVVNMHDMEHDLQDARQVAIDALDRLDGESK